MEQIIARTEKVKDGQTILEEGTWAYWAYVVQSGKAKVLKNVHGKQVQIGSLKKGDIFGEMSFIGGTKRTASVIADGDSEIGMIPRDVFLEAISQLPKNARERLDGLVSDLTGLSEICAHLVSRLGDVEKMKSRMIDVKSFEKEIEKMPETLRQVVTTLAERLNLTIEGCTKLAAKIEESVRPAESVSLKMVSKAR